MAVTRRQFITASAVAGGGLLVAFRLTGSGDDTESFVDGDSWQANSFVRINPDGSIDIAFHKTDMGQGISTGLPMIIAEELDADWERVRIVRSDIHPDRYGYQGTGGSNSVRGSWDQLRQAGATARAMLVAAAAERLAVPASELRTESSEVIHDGSGRRLGYGEIATLAGAQTAPNNPPLKSPSEYRILGRPLPRRDTPEKVNGSAGYGIDARPDNLIYATVVHPPQFGASIRGFDDAAARRVPGVMDVLEISSGVAVVAENTWSAFRGARELRPQWNASPFTRSSDDISNEMRRLASEPGNIARQTGDPAPVLNSASNTIQAEYEVPYLAHATMEPMNCTVLITDQSCEAWVGTQSPQAVLDIVGEISGHGPTRVTVHPTLLGGGFGRRSDGDFVREAAEIANRFRGRPVKMTWTREEDTRCGRYRPTTFNTFRAALGSDGMPTAWYNRIVGQSILESKGRQLRNGVDGTSVEGAANLPYDIPNIQVEFRSIQNPVPLHWWRSVGSSQNAFITESFIDELAHAAGQDPFEYRRRLLRNHPRHLAVLERAARESGWGTRLPNGRARGIAVAESFGSFVAQVAEVSVGSSGPRVHRVTCVVDCGIHVNPDTIAAQMESGIVYGLTAARYGRIDIDSGAATQSNFHDYHVLRMAEMPEVDTHIIQSTEAPGGIGEPGTPPIAPAVTNAIYALNGRRIRRLPIADQAAG